MDTHATIRGKEAAHVIVDELERTFIDRYALSEAEKQALLARGYSGGERICMNGRVVGLLPHLASAFPIRHALTWSCWRVRCLAHRPTAGARKRKAALKQAARLRRISVKW